MTNRQFQSAIKAYRKFCEHIGIEFKGETENTPARVVRAMIEMTINTGKKDLDFHFTEFTATGDQLIVVKDIDYTSLCEHHHLPFFGHAHVGYVPIKKIAGLSKFHRLVEFYSKRPSIQEWLTSVICDDLFARLQPKGVIVMLEARHTCVCARGVNAFDSTTVTCALRGEVGFKDEFFSHVRGYIK